MAQNTSQIGTRRFDKELNEDVNDFHLPDNSWTHARNAINNSITGDLGKLGNEPSNTLCITIKYANCSNTLDPKIIGTVHVIADTWVIFSTNGTCHEIGVFTESLCKYETIVNDPCLNFSFANLIKGVSRPVVTCTHRVYWDDGLNPTRFLTFTIDPVSDNSYLNPNSPIPWQQDCIDSNGNAPGSANYPVGCVTCTNKNVLDCDKLRLATFIDTPCVEVQNGFGQGTLLNGSYMVAIAYAVDGLKVSDWYISNVQSLFEHNNASCSLDVILNDLDTRFDEIQVALISIVNQQTVARYAGVYSTRQKRLSFDTIDNTWPTIPIEQIPVMTPVIEKTDATYTIGSYLVRTGPTSKLNFNYQPLANQIVTKWQSIRYPHDYYRKGGNKTNYLRDEVYAFFIRWVYDTGDKSSSYHIPGRSIFANEDTQLPQYTANDALPVEVSGGFANRWAVQNTATFENPLNIPLPDGGVVIAEGLMGYWESTEKYPDTKPEVWNSVNNPLGPAFNTTVNPYSNFNPSAVLTDLDLCGKQIRHHKFPDLYIHDRNKSWSPVAITQLEYSQVISNQRYINILGVAFDNIKLPIDLNGNPIPGIVGYEILRGTRNGNKTILAKGLIKNLRKYNIPSSVGTSIAGSTKTNLFINYPYNDLGPDKFLSSVPATPLQGNDDDSQGDPHVNLLNQFEEKVISFHSPDTNFTEPFLSPKEVKLHGEFRGGITGKFEYSEKHPQEKLISNTAFVMSAIAGIGIAVVAASGKRSINYISPKTPGFSEENLARKTDNKNDYDLNNNYNLDFDMADIYTTYSPYVYFPGSFYTFQDHTITGDVDTTGYTQGYSQIYYDGNQYDLVQTSPTYVDRQYIKGTSSADPAALIFLKFFSNLTSTGYNDNRPTNLITDITQTLNPLDAPKSETDRVVTFVDDNIQESKDHPAMGSGGIDVIKEDGALDNIPTGLKLINKFPLWINYFTQGTDTILNLIRAALPYQDYALRYHSHCLYDTYTPPVIGNQRRDIVDISYVGPDITNFSTNYRINNLYRSKAVVLSTPVSFSPPRFKDVSRIKATDVDALYEPEFANFSQFTTQIVKNPTKLTFGQGFTPSFDLAQFIGAFYQKDPNGFLPLPNTGSSHYASLKQRLRNQYGQITGINQVPVSTCTITVNKTRGNTPLKSGTLFGGDTYVGRYTEKNTFFYFYNWLYGEPDGAQFDYTKNQMIPYPIYWANFDGFKTTDFMSSFSNWITTLGIGANLILPSDFHNLDRGVKGILSLTIDFYRPYIAYSYFYLFNSGVLDFYTESEINLDLRDWGELETERHYDPWRYDDTKALFDTGIIKATNYYKYDFSLSYSKLFLNYTSWASAQKINYNPYLAETCFVYSPNKIIYSLPNQYESLRDNWSIFLANNYKDFENRVTCIKPVNKSGAIIFFDASSPVMFQGTDTLETGLGTKLVIGDGGLFAQPLQNIVNADAPYEYASCQDRLSVINTPLGIYWISQNQGKIFSYTNGLNELSMNDIKWWLTLYLPFKLVDQFPNFALIDNPVFGVGTQTIYDNQNGLIYFTKKDYSLKTDLPPSISVKYVSENKFDIFLNNIFSVTIYLGDNTIVNKKTGIPIWKEYFDDASWTISYDPKVGSWISYHDWHPDLVMPGKNTFLSTKDNSIWVHNTAFQSYNNYYGINYPFEVEYVVNTIQTITTLRSVEYQLECYKYNNNAFDRFHVLDFNFDKVVIYNTEQVSGYLRLNLDPKNDLSKLLNYPIIGANVIDILFSKEENKYRFNQFWDITDDRGENNPSAQRMIWNTAANGYDRTLNTANLNYAKDVFQLKKFRHYTNTVWLRKDPANDTNLYPTGSNPYKMLVILTNNKELYSPR